jgi:hypothetical protein
MKKNSCNLVFSLIIVGLIIFTIAILPVIVNRALGREQSPMIRIFYSIFLCLPYLRVVQFYSNNPDFIRATKSVYSDYQKNGNVWAYYLDKLVYTLMVTSALFFALRNSFEILNGYHYLSIILYGSSVLLLNIGLHKHLILHPPPSA